LLVRDFLAKTSNHTSATVFTGLGPLRHFLVPKTEKSHERTKRRFATIEKIKTASLEELKAISKSAYQKCFEDWKKRWHKCIISEGDYFEGDKIDIDE